MDNIVKKITELEKKATKYDNMRSRYVEHAKQIKKAADILLEVIKVIDPFLSLSSRNKSGIDYKNIICEVYEKMRAGTEITSDMLLIMYPELNDQGVRYVIDRLRQTKTLEVRKEGRKAFYYVQKEIL